MTKYLIILLLTLSLLLIGCDNNNQYSNDTLIGIGNLNNTSGIYYLNQSEIMKYNPNLFYGGYMGGEFQIKKTKSCLVDNDLLVAVGKVSNVIINISGRDEHYNGCCLDYEMCFKNYTLLNYTS
jgi:hypothetical protein